MLVVFWTIYPDADMAKSISTLRPEKDRNLGFEVRWNILQSSALNLGFLRMEFLRHEERANRVAFCSLRYKPLQYASVAGQKEGTTILKLTGSLTLSKMFPLQEELRSLTPSVLILDFSDVPYMDSAGLGIIPNYQVSAERDGRKLLLAGLTARVQTLLSHTKIDTVVAEYLLRATFVYRRNGQMGRQIPRRTG
jgi:anti-anti-sigma factor